MVKGKAWSGIKDPPAGEGQVGQKNTSLSKEGRGGSKKTALQGGYIPCPFGKGKGLGVG